jgi:hypothetical protein
MTTPKTVEQKGYTIEFLPAARQKEAMSFLQQQLFNTPKWLIDESVIKYTGDNGITTIANLQDAVLARLINNTTISKLLRFEAEGENAYSAMEMMNDLKRGIWSELAARKPIDMYRRNLQKSYVDRLTRIVNPEPQSAVTVVAGGFGGAQQVASRNNDVVSVSKAQLRSLASEIKAALPSYKEGITRAHLMDVLDRINEALNPHK